MNKLELGANITQTCRNLLVNNRFEELYSQLKVIMTDYGAILKLPEKDILNNIDALYTKYTNTKRHEMLGTISFSEAQTNRAQVALGFLEVISTIEAAFKTADSKLILFVSSCPDGMIDARFREEGDDIKIITQNAKTLRFADFGSMTMLKLTNLITNQKPNILHIAAHGQPGPVLCFEQNDQKETQKVQPAEFQLILKMATNSGANIELALLNCCYSADFAKALVDGGVLPLAIGTNNKVPDPTAKAFSKHFYNYLANTSVNYTLAFDYAKLQINQDKDFAFQVGNNTGDLYEIFKK
jgi:hypothetical protein